MGHDTQFADPPRAAIDPSAHLMAITAVHHAAGVPGAVGGRLDPAFERSSAPARDGADVPGEPVLTWCGVYARIAGGGMERPPLNAGCTAPCGRGPRR